MKVETEIEFESDDRRFVAKISGDVKKHFSCLEVHGFLSDAILTHDECDAAMEKLMETARAEGHIPEEEPDARRSY